MSLLSRPKLSSNGCYQDITPKSANWDFVGFKAYELEPSQTLNLTEVDNELCLVILSGKADIAVEDEDDDSCQQRDNDQGGDDEDVPQAHGGILDRESDGD